MVAPVAGMRTRPSAPPRSPARPTRNADRTRAAILDAATREFARYGLSGARVDRIAVKADINKRMLYHYFGAKEALFLAVLEATYARIRTAETTLSLLDVAPEESVRRLVEFTWRYYLEHPEFITLLNNENLYHARHLKRSRRLKAMNSPLIETLAKVLARGQRDGVFRHGVDALQLYVSIAALAYFFLSNNYTLSAIFGRDLGTAAARRVRLAHMTAVVLGYLRP
jgi:AcrR family transcriptional regulator